MADAIVVAPGEGATIHGPAGGPLTFKVRGEQTEGRLLALENVIAPLDGPPLHSHDNEDESWYVIEGTLRFKLGERIERAAAGSFVFVPRGTAHCFQNVGDGPARILVIFNPSGMERFFDEFAALKTVHPGAFRTIGHGAGMRVLGPPLGQSDPLETAAG
jgi:quercetin dioxygenase-like cupin family protein